MNGEKTGIRTAVAESFRPDDPVPGAVAAEQLPLLPLRQVGGAAAEAEPDPARRGAGRPPGAKNRSTEAWRKFLLSQYPSPLVALAEMYSRSVFDLALELGFASDQPGGRKAKPEELLELVKIQLQCAKELAPYVHQKQPMAIEAGNGGLMQLVINTGTYSAKQVEEAGVMRVNFIDVESESNQGLSGTENQNSVVADSAGSTQAIEAESQNGERQTD